MKRLVVCVFILLVSCDYFENKKVKTEDIVSQELETIDWKSVDEYPSFTVCDSVSEKQARKQCFESTILNHVNDYLSKQSIVVSQDVEDTIAIKLKIDNLGEISILDIKTKPETQEIIPEIDTLLRGSIASLPKIFPAVKRSQNVTTEFILPVVVSIK
ncbi:hypothetical protein [Winogradskyella jejuensis]|uniref:TonB protein C-terminal n=1 Tax=Winogradskyella jejuensis TaxID=1089305 RepID=A0A1M5P743_9FLAO|nr:hypothetical protein [Winogradskyella jejuensis]SHG97651.1 hypothetical protein SAMN05444148_1400 [Winogradskyella jejuensis]